MRVDFIVLSLFFLLTSCGYNFQRSNSATLQSKGIRKIYVAPLANESFKAGIENVVYNEIIQVIASHRAVSLVSRQEEADAILEGTVNGATYQVSAGTGAGGLYGGKNSFAWQRQAPDGKSVATEYTAGLSCAFSLKAVHPLAGKDPVLWSSGFDRSKSFPANNQMFEFGTTSNLINESEFDRALKDMAHQMMADLHESMVSMF